MAKKNGNDTKQIGMTTVLSPEQVLAKGMELAVRTQDLAEKRLEASESASGFRKEVKALVAETKRLADEVKTGKAEVAAEQHELPRIGGKAKKAADEEASA